MLVVRRVGAVVLALAAVAVWLFMAPVMPQTPQAQVPEAVDDRGSDIRQALSDYRLNELTASSAPQQQVVNGWAAKDLLTIIAEQQNDALTRDPVAAPVAPVVPHDDRVPALIGLLVLGLALFLVTSPRPIRQRDGDVVAAVVPPHPQVVPVA